jgi:NAD(P)-dependent dehydrogenase (short-subunit alcohol dehydrogenase family)
LARDGYKVAVADITSVDNAALIKKWPGKGHRSYTADVSDEEAVKLLFTSVERELGSIAVLIVAAGIAGLVEGKRPTLRHTSTQSWDRVMDINAKGAFLCTREMLIRREAVPVKDARIVLLASIAAQAISSNAPPAYIASKGAVLALTKAAAAEGAHLGVTVNAVAPGTIDTPMLRSAMPAARDASFFSGSAAKRAGSPLEVASAIRFLASPEASYLNGSCIDVNGGFAMR